MILDPMPIVDMRLAPAAAMAARQDPYLAEGQAVVRKNTGDIQTALAGIGVSWPAARIAWDSYRPHPEISDLPQEVVFVGTGSGNPHAFDASHPESAGLQDLPLMFPGYLTPAEGTSVRFEPLLQTGSLSGTASYFQLVQPTPAGPVLKVDIPHQPEGHPLILAAHLHGSEGARPLNAIVVADLDFISDQIFSMRAQSTTGANFDNVTFFLNCIDVLAGDESFIELRKRRVRYRTLSRVEAQTRNFVERLAREEQQARAESETALSRARGALEQSQRRIESRTDIDAQAKQIMVRNLVEAENRKLRVLQVNVEQARDLKIEASREAMESGIRRIQGTIRTTAVMLPPLPILVLGATVVFRRRRNERRSAAALRRLRDVE
jgi:ABC-2 type transport system permease protein